MNLWKNSLIALFLGMTLAACNEHGSTQPVTPPKPQEPPFVPAPSQVGPIQFSHPEFLFGTVKSGDTVRASYKFKNMKDYSVSIAQVFTSCECMKVDYPTRPLNPGEINEIKVTFTTDDYHNVTMEKIVSVLPEKEEIPVTLYLKGEIK